MNNIHTIANMADKNNENVLLSPLSNIEEISERKSGWGYVKIAVPNDIAYRLVNANNFVGGLLLVDRAEFEKEKSNGGKTSHWMPLPQPPKGE